MKIFKKTARDLKNVWARIYDPHYSNGLAGAMAVIIIVLLTPVLFVVNGVRAIGSVL